MGDQIARAQDFEKKAEKKLTGWGLFSSKYEDAADLFDKAANAYKLAKSWIQAGAVYLKLASCYLKLDSKHEAANSFADAGHCYKKANSKEAVTCLEQAINLFLDIGRLNMAARYCKEIAEIYEQERNLEQAIVYYEKAVDLFQSEENNSTANQCRQKIAEFAAELEQLAYLKTLLHMLSYFGKLCMRHVATEFFRIRLVIKSTQSSKFLKQVFSLFYIQAKEQMLVHGIAINFGDCGTFF